MLNQLSPAPFKNHRSGSAESIGSGRERLRKGHKGQRARWWLSQNQL